MKKVKSEKAPAEATRKKPQSGRPAVQAAAKATTVTGPVKQQRAKSAGPTSERRRPVKAKRARAKRPVKRGSATKVAAAAKGKRPVKGAVPPAPPVLQIRRLDPVRICGDRTSVVQLFRVDEQAMAVGKAAGARQVHLVFNDRHGWYCEHGRSCHAVSAVMRHAGIR
ncbi:MAG TPA: hypothetical protein VF761_05150 [Gemmatimonadaceae bacterium]